MSRLLISHYLNDLARLKQVSGTHRESVVREAFLPYYIANLNIEATYAAITGEYVEFPGPGLCLVDTLDNTGGLGKKTGDQIADLFGMGDENVERIKRQNKRKISVIIGNPPYNANQLNENDNNKNRVYPEIDRRIKDSYIKASTAQKTKLYDMYSRFFRWASDRLHDDGVLAFITNRSFLDARTFDGFRKVVAQEFAEIRIVDLGGDVRANPKLCGTKHNVFGIQTGVAISFLVKKRGSKGARIFYARRPEMETAEEKLSFLSGARLRELAMEEVAPDKTNNWLNLTSNDFETLLPLVPAGPKVKAVFALFSNGIVTARDDWMVDFNETVVSQKVEHFISRFRSEQLRWRNSPESKLQDAQKRRSALTDFVSREIKWTSELEVHLDRSTPFEFSLENIRRSAYRPFVKAPTYFAKVATHRTYQQDRIFPIGQPPNNLAIGFSGLSSSKPFQTLVVDDVPSFDLLEKTQFLPFRRLDEFRQWQDNITDWALKQFKDHYKAPVTPAKAGVQRPSASSAKATAKSLGSRLRGNDEQEQGEQEQGKQEQDEQKQGAQRQAGQTQGGRSAAITKQAIFHYVYAVLHDPLYRDKYAQNLKREFPRIPLYDDALAAFWQWAAWGDRPMALHIGYDTVEPWPLTRTDIEDDKARSAGQSPRPLLKADKPAGRIVLDSETTLSGIPPEAWTYTLGNRSALEWILDQYKESKPRDPTIREKFNSYRFADHKEKVIDLLTRVTRVSVETQAIVDQMRSAAR